MKIRNNGRKGRRGLRAILCGLVCFMCIAYMDMSVRAEVDMADFPNVYVSPDGASWTTVDELPYCEDYHVPNYERDYMFPFWRENGETIGTGEVSRKAEPGVGQHLYNFERRGDVPVLYWEVYWYNGRCIHNGLNRPHLGITNMDTHKCSNAYWSGLAPYCAYCEGEISGFLHYIKPETAANINWLNLDMGYYYLCPHSDSHSGAKVEQSFANYNHTCSDISYNRYKVVYDKNEFTARGSMEPSFHMYNNETEYNGYSVTPNKFLHRNQFTRTGYVFDGWSLNPDGSGERFVDCAEIYNLTTENFDEELNEDPNEGVVILYAQWKRSGSDLKIDTKGGKYDDGVGVVNGDKTTYSDRPYGMNLTLNAESYLTPPNGYKVSFVTNGGTAVDPIRSQKVFNSWKKGTPFTGRLLDNVFQFIGGDDTLSVIEATYDNGSIILPESTKGDETLVGWYKDPGLTEIIGVPGVPYTPDEDITLYAKWEVDLVLYATNDLTVDSYKGGVDLRWEAAGGTNKSFKIYQKLKDQSDSEYRMLVDANNLSDSLSVNKVFDFTGTVKTYTVPYSGFYKFDVNGAQGKGFGSKSGGKGGQVTGEVWLNAGDVLTITVGGQNGYNGGGAGSAQGGNGGGATVVKSSQKGILFIAGGGGGATSDFNGGRGGAETSLTSTSVGQGGTAGGGGGYRGGTCGHVIYHNHATYGCAQHTHIGNTASGGVCYTSSLDDVVCGTYEKQEAGRTCATCYDGHIENHVSQGVACSCAVHPGGPVLWVGSGMHNPFGSASWHNYSIYYKLVCTGCGEDRGYYEALESSEHVKTQRVYVLSCTLPAWLCGKNNGDVESTEGAYGGSNYVQSSIMANYYSKAGHKAGNGSVKITSANIGYQVSFAMDNVSANDTAKPDVIDASTVELDDNGRGIMTITWGNPEDNGTTYNHFAQSFDIVTSAHLCDSNETENTITTGVYRYFYRYDTSASTVVTAANKQGVVAGVDGEGNVLTEVSTPVAIPEDGTTNYLHVAAVDRAGNVGPTHTVPVAGDITEEDGDPYAWRPATEQVQVSSVIGGRDYNNVYLKEGETYYVKADNSTPFKLSYLSGIEGNAREDYQVNHLLYNVTSNASTNEQIYTTVAEYTPVDQVRSVGADILSRTAGGSGSFLRDAMNSAVARSRYAKDVSFYQTFRVPASQNGNTLTVVPVAGASYVAEDGFPEVKYSDWTDDVSHAIYLIPDAEAPTVLGADVLETMVEYDRDTNMDVVISATDALSGVRSIKVTVRNLDNMTTQTFTQNAEGNVVIPINNANILFYGAVSFTIEAVDNVGNVRQLSYNADNLGLVADVTKTVPNGLTTYARGEGAKLDILTTGYAERVEIIWPSGFDASLPSSFDYAGNTDFARTECIPFIIPSANVTEYDIVVRAYKNGMMKEETITLHIYGEMSGRVRIR